ncbi:hypothetical protein TNCV_434951 [Trichonephila clavipes]|nr:hypothetical protein TNCV_434951 [Trichonephila clavipes]
MVSQSLQLHAFHDASDAGKRNRTIACHKVSLCMTSEKSRLNVGHSAVAFSLKFNWKGISCCKISDFLENDTSTKKNHSMGKILIKKIGHLTNIENNHMREPA